MAPKKRGGKGAKGPTVVDALAPEDMSKEQLLEHMVRLRQELDRERQERNSFQLECNRIQGCWEITRRELEERKAELRTRDREMEEAQERHQLEIKVYKQKVKHLLHEQQENLTELKAEGVLSLRRAQKDHWEQEQELWKEKRSLNIRLNEQELANEAAITNLCLKHEEEMARLRSDFELQTKAGPNPHSFEMEAKYTRKMQALRDELDLRRKTEIHELEERKNTQISELIGNHEGAFGAIKNYYNDITAKNLTLINLLKEQVEELKKKEAVLEKEKADVMRENKGLTEPLQEAQELVAELQKKLVHYYRDKEALMTSKAHLKIAQKELKDLQWEHEVLEQRFSQVQEERDDLYQNFTKAINEVQQKTGFKNLLLERKLHGLLTLLEQKEVELSEVLAASNLDPSALALVSHKLEDMLNSKNATIQDLQIQLARVCKAHNDMLQTFKAKLTAFGIPLDNLGFQPLSFPIPGQELGQGPAGLVSVPT
ncbi:differentially expressed in FDCP 8 homolog isoform X5 [Haemorhous mexicanus]|uniref:differentially expressed in FDCP 8 homolog isoform X5 n=1 Tax=Haemorhous mexicanus TaxID=30427 RepID=UPI0028BD5C68|nr:differentially expressed in FDCP 8 homolog isoform X5 [Haemorhous mexicanus]